MNITATMVNKEQAKDLVDSLRYIGFEQSDINIRQVSQQRDRNDFEETAEEITFIDTMRDGQWKIEPLRQDMKGLNSKEGIIVTVEATRRDADKVRLMMEQSGAIEVIQE